MKECGLKVAVLAHTGVAALTIEGQPIWSTERLAKSKAAIAEEFLKRKFWFWCSTLQSYRTMIIDEISMVDPHV